MSIKHIRVETEEDSLFLKDDEIHAIVGGNEHVYKLSAVKKLVLITTDKGPFNDDVCLAVDVGENVIFVMSGHRCYFSFLYDQIGKILPLDYQKIINASRCIDNNLFEIYNCK